ncbi:MAG TPA: LytTR family DNA-binding domain-containing protein [Casimicrobiaceae bacterium]|nr:LytTR family DNA-binding domain-containing protein [Casimicrobiaceae bacterium]
MSRPTAVIAEDEPLLLDELRESLAELWPEVEIKAEARNGVEAIRALEAYEPDVLFLDIQMPGMSGVEVARIASRRCHVVFVTAFDQYAVAAFEHGALDYVMKPLSRARLATAVDRVRERLRSAPASLEPLLQALAEQPHPRKKFLRWISVAHGKAVRLITTDEICYFRADNKYTTVVTASTESLINKSIKELLDELDPDAFYQIHRGTIVNINAIASVHRDLHGRLEMRLKQRKEALSVSASFASRFKKM